MLLLETRQIPERWVEGTVFSLPETLGVMFARNPTKTRSVASSNATGIIFGRKAKYTQILSDAGCRLATYIPQHPPELLNPQSPPMYAGEIFHAILILPWHSR